MTRPFAALVPLALAACASEAATRISAPELHLAEDMPTLVLATWEPPGDAPDALRLEWSTDGGDWSSPAIHDDPRWRAAAFGLRPVQTYSFRLVGTWDGEEEESEAVSIETGALAAEAPQLTLEEADGSPGWVAAGINNATSGAAVFDESGEAVWWWPVPVPTLLVTRALRSVDQRSILVGSFVPIGDYADKDLAIHRVAYDGTLLERIATPGAHHDFTELPDGTLAWLTGEERSFGGPVIRGDVLMERAPDGTERVVWNCWDDYTYDPDDPRLDNRFLHANAVKYDADTERYWVSLRSLGVIVVIDRATGDIVEQFFGDDSLYPLAEGGTPVVYQHSFSLLEQGFVIMDDRNGETSRAAEFTIDRAAGTFTETWVFESDQGLRVQGLGDAIRTADGESLLVWSSAGQLQRVTADGQTRWRGTTELGTVLGYAQHTDDPAAQPR